MPASGTISLVEGVAEADVGEAVEAEVTAQEQDIPYRKLRVKGSAVPIVLCLDVCPCLNRVSCLCVCVFVCVYA